MAVPLWWLVPAYPGLIVLLGLAAAVEHNAAAMLRSRAGMATLINFYLIIGLAARDALGAVGIRLAGLLGLALAWQNWDVLLAGGGGRARAVPRAERVWPPKVAYRCSSEPWALSFRGH